MDGGIVYYYPFNSSDNLLAPSNNSSSDFILSDFTNGQLTYSTESKLNDGNGSALVFAPGISCVPENRTPFLGLDDYSVSFWFRTGAANQSLFRYAGNRFTVLMTSGRVNFAIRNFAQNVLIVNILTPIGTSYANNEWHHVCFSVSTTQGNRGYLNGVQVTGYTVGSQNTNFLNTSDIVESANRYTLADDTETGGTYFSDYALWNTFVSQETTQAIYEDNFDYKIETIIKAEQTIAFDALPQRTFVLNETIPLNATSDSGLPVTYSSDNTSVVEVGAENGNPVLIIKGAGSAKITASQPGNDFFNPADSVEQTQTIKARQTITFDALPPQPFTPNGKIQLTATASSDLPVTYSSDNTSVVEVGTENGNPVLIIKGIGTAKITASQDGDDVFDEAESVQQTQIITKGVNNITFDYTQPSSSVYILQATSSSGLPVMYASSDTTTAIIEIDKLTFLRDGQVTVTATHAGDNNYLPATPIAEVFIRETRITNYREPITATVNTTNPIIQEQNGNILVLIKGQDYTEPSGIAYAIDSGFRGTVAVVSISAFSETSEPIRDFSSNPLQVSFNLPNADPTSSLHLFKLDENLRKIDPQPPGFPVQVMRHTGFIWRAELPSLSTFLIQNENPPSGGAGGDPHIMTMAGGHVFIPNHWKRVRLYEKGELCVYARCNYLTKDVVDQMHVIRRDGSMRKLDAKRDIYIIKYTYFTHLEIYKNGRIELQYDMIRGKTVFGTYPVFANEDCHGLYSMQHKLIYPPKRLTSVFLYLNNNNLLTVTTDPFWDDVNHIVLSMYDKHDDSYTGEFFEHSAKNNIKSHN